MESADESTEVWQHPKLKFGPRFVYFPLFFLPGVAGFEPTALQKSKEKTRRYHNAVAAALLGVYEWIIFPNQL